MKYILNTFLNGGTFSTRDEYYQLITITYPGFLPNILYFIKEDNVCITNTVNTLKCDAERTNISKIYPLTRAEAAFAGGKVDIDNPNYYLTRNPAKNHAWWLLSNDIYRYDNSDYPSIVTVSGNISRGRVTLDYSTQIRPTITLIENLVLKSGNGSLDNPYEVELINE